MKLALLAGTQSGCGKTTITLALLQYLQTQQKVVGSFKVGPDFLDPFWHQAVTGQQSYNLDTRMVGLEQSRRLLNQQKPELDFAVIEGVMGLFDGRTGVGKDGSSADLAKALDCPVILAVDAKGISGSIVPLVSGYCDYAQRMGVEISGVIANRVGSAHHAALLKGFIEDYNLPPLLAWMEKQAPSLPERHLGLVMPDQESVPDFADYFHVEKDLILQAFSLWQNVQTQSYKAKLLTGKTIAIAKDAASCFIYPANIDCLQALGAEIEYFSILAGEVVPETADALWLPGGYPELHGHLVSQSASLVSIRQFIQGGYPVLAECGGGMLLGETLTDQQGDVWSMAGVLPFHSKMQKKLASLGYREDTSGIRGHEFHYSVREMDAEMESCFQCQRGDKGIRYKNLRASYIHWYFASAPEIIASWLS